MGYELIVDKHISSLYKIKFFWKRYIYKKLLMVQIMIYYVEVKIYKNNMSSSFNNFPGYALKILSILKVLIEAEI